MVETELAEDGAVPHHSKDIHRAKSRSSRRERSSVTKEARGNSETVKKKRRTHTPDDYGDNSLIEHAFVILEGKNQDDISKSTVREKKKHKSDNIENGANIDKRKREKSSSTIGQKRKSSKYSRKLNLYTESTEKLPTKDKIKHENIKEGVKFDENVKYGDESYIIGKSKSSYKPTSESGTLRSVDKHRDNNKEKVKNRAPKSHRNDGNEKQKVESTLKRIESSDRFKITIKTKERIHTDLSEIGVTKNVEMTDKTPKKKEIRGKRRKEDSHSGITLICSPERKSKKSRHSENTNDSRSRYSENTDYARSRHSVSTHDANKSRDRSEKEHKKESPSREQKKKRRYSSERIDSISRSGRSKSHAIEPSNRLKDSEGNDSPYETAKKHKKEKSKRHHSEKSFSRSSRHKDHREKSKETKENFPIEYHTHSRSKRDKHLENESGSLGPQGSIANKHEDRKKKKNERSTVENSEIIYEVEESEAILTHVDREETNSKLINCATFFERNKIPNEGSKKNKSSDEAKMILRKNEALLNAVKTDKLIKVSNKENILLKGVQDLTVKELYLMENLKDYELKLNEQCLKKLKRKKREYKSMNDGIAMQHAPPVTNIPVCRLPSVKEIFKISNLADYEKKYKEMQDKKRKKNVEGDTFSVMGRKKLTKFSLASKEDSPTVEDKPSGLSSQWFLNNIRGTIIKNEGGGEVVCNMGLLLEAEKNKNNKEKYFEKGDAKGPYQIREIARGFRTTSKTKLSVREHDHINDFDTSATYLKMCEKFRKDIREESKKLLQNLAENKNWGISIKDNSLQSIKKKPSLTSNDGFSSTSNFDYIHKKQRQIDSNNKGEKTKNITQEPNNNKLQHSINENSQINNDFPWLPPTTERVVMEENISTAQIFDANSNKNMGVFINKYSPSPEDLFGTDFPEHLNSQSPKSRESENLNGSTIVSSSSFSLSMFEKDKDSSDNNNTSVTNSTGLNTSKPVDLSREIPEMNFLQKQDETESIDESLTPWIHRSGTLERIINQIEDSPEKDTNPSPKIFRDCRFENQSNKTFSEIEKSKNVLLSYINHINFTSKTQKMHKSIINKAEKTSHIIFDELSDQSILDNKCRLNEKKIHDSLSCLRDFSSFKDETMKPHDFIKADESSIVCSRSCASIKTLKSSKNKKPCKNVLKASLQSASTTFKCDLKAEAEPNGMNTKLIISDPSKRNNILQIQFCGKLNINFNKDNIELGSIENYENQKPVDVKSIEQSRKTEVIDIGHEKIRSELDTVKLSNEKKSHTKANIPAENHENNISQEPMNNNLSNISNCGSDSSKTVVFCSNQDNKQTQVTSENQDRNNKDDFPGYKEESNLEKPVKIMKTNNRNDSFGSDDLSTLPSFVQDISSSKTMVVTDEKSCYSTKNTEILNDNFVSGKRTNNNEKVQLSSTEVEFIKGSQTQSSLPFNQENVHHDQFERKERCNANNDNEVNVGSNKESDVLNQISKKDIDLIHDASAQTELPSCSDKTNFINVKDTCASSTFESKDKTNFNSEDTFISSSFNVIEAGNKSFSSSTNSTGNDTLKNSSDNTCNNVTSSSIDGIDIILNDKTEPSLIDKGRAEDDGNNKLPQNKTKEINIGFQLTSTDNAPKNEHLGPNKPNFPLGLTYTQREKDLKSESCFHSTQNSHFCHNSKNSAQDKNQTKVTEEKKKLLLSHSEEEAFKYLLLKGIGKASAQDKNISNETAYDINNWYSNPKLMFSTIKSRLEYLKNNSESLKVIPERSCGNLVSSKIRKAPPYRPISQESKCFSCLGCPCNQSILSSNVWERQRQNLDQRRKEIKTESQCRNSIRNSFMISSREKPCSENPLFDHRVCHHEASSGNNLCSRRAASGYFDYDDLNEISLPTTRYDVENEYDENSASKLWDPRSVRKEQALYGCPTFKNENDFCRSHVDRKLSRDHQSWSEYDRKYSPKNSAVSALNQRSAAETTIPRQSHRTATGYPYQSQVTADKINHKHIAHTTASVPIRHEQHLLNDIFHKKESYKQRSAKMLPRNQPSHPKLLNENETEQINDASQQDREGECNQGNELDKKKLSRKHKFSKHASKLWKSIFKKNKKYDDEILEYQQITPEGFLEQRPKLQENKIKIKKWLKKISQSKASDFQSVQGKLFKKLNKIMTSEVTMPLQEVFDIIQKPQFHKDNHSYSGRKRFERVHTTNYLSDDGHYIMITEHLNVRGFLVSIGLKDDVAWEAQNNPELNSRLYSAISEARSWANKITMSQGLLIYILAVMTPTEVHHYYLQIVEAIINSRISNVGTLLSVMMVLKRYERGKYGIKSVISKDHVRELVPKQISDTERKHQENRARFIFLYNIAKRAAAKINTKVDKESAGLLARLTASYTPGLKPYLTLLSHYIAQRVIKEKGQLTMAVNFLQSLSTRHFDQAKFELSCGLPQYKVVLKGAHGDQAVIKELNKELNLEQEKEEGKGGAKKENEKDETGGQERLQASWVQRRKVKPLKESQEKIPSEKSNLERKPSTMDLLKDQNKT